LTPEEEMAFQSLPREAEPSDILEGRVVRSLREEGLLGSRAGKEADIGGLGGGGGWYRPWMAVASIAASLVLFASGVVLGQWMGSESTTQAFIQVREQDATQVALRIQEAGSAYVAALAALGEYPKGSTGEGVVEGRPAQAAGTDLRQGREVALGALYGAAYELARLDPDDGDLFQVLQILQERRARDEGSADANRNVIWF
jgi:hypothetical protein